ncbi:MAG: haloacid dehalogenase-like hydrolase [Lachnospiraceae bacterium]|nr:haloacid dehalogenase-like hydrolase [Lachnospiraceae bacterium]
MKKTFTVIVCILMIFATSLNSYAAEIMKRGSNGSDVREVQEMLISLGYLNDKADGKYGPKTEAAVLAFQREQGLDATGIVGEGTYNALKKNTAGPKGGSAEPDTAFSSWTEGCSSLDELTSFVSECTDKTNPAYLEPADRIAVFDMDGTILCEKAPVYIDYCLTMYRVLDDPSYKATEEEKDAMQQVRDHAYSEGETFHPEGITKDDLVASAFAGMTPEEFREYVVDFADSTDVVGFEGMTYGQSFYKPMIEVINYLKANDFDVWMVSACEREVVRALVERYGIPYDHVIATDVPYVASGKGDNAADDYNMEKEETILLGEPLDEVECGKSGKPAAIAREIGKRPVLAFGNSSGDYSMLNYAEGNPEHEGMGFFIVCDDTEREYGSEKKAADYCKEAEKQGWTAISMADDWATIYGEGVRKTELPGAEEKLPGAA